MYTWYSSINFATVIGWTCCRERLWLALEETRNQQILLASDTSSKETAEERLTAPSQNRYSYVSLIASTNAYSGTNSTPSIFDIAW